MVTVSHMMVGLQRMLYYGGVRSERLHCACCFLSCDRVQTDTKIMIRGKGSVKENKLGKGAQPMPGEDEPLHALIIATTPEALKRGVDKVCTVCMHVRTYARTILRYAHFMYVCIMYVLGRGVNI